jgi:hypothetical protein
MRIWIGPTRRERRYRAGNAGLGAGEEPALGAAARLGRAPQELRPAARVLRALALLLALAPEARALVVEAGPAEAERAPATGLGFEHVGKIGGTTGVYLGEGWVLTAGHVGAGEIWLEGVKYPAVAGSWAPLRGELHTSSGPERASAPDLGVFRVSPRPPLPALAITRRKPELGEPLLLVGCGFGRGERLEWDGRAGFRWGPSNVCRWGTNRVAAVGIDLPRAGTSTRVFATLFTAGSQQEAQAALGDSGGAAFLRRRGSWLLAGIMISVVTFPGQPPQTVVDGNATHLAELSHYRDAILALTGLRPASAGDPDP